MTDQMMFDTWAQLLRPLFPVDAQFTFKSRRRVIQVGCSPADEQGRPGPCANTLNIAFTQLAWKTYRGARSARRAKADTNLIAMVQASLAQAGGEEGVYEFPSDGLLVEVASIDLFPPLNGAMQSAGRSLSAA